MRYLRLTTVSFLALIGLFVPPNVGAGFMPSQAQILSDMVLANNYFTNKWPMPGCVNCLDGGHPSCIWTRSTYIEGTLALYGLNHDTNIYNYAVRWGAFTNWSLRYGDTDPTSDDQGPGQEYIELYNLDATQTNRLTHIVNNVNLWTKSHLGLTVCTYVDTLHMTLPTFAKLSVLNSNVIPALNTNYLFSPEMYSYFHNLKSVIGYSNGLFNTNDHLWWRDTNFLYNYTASDGTKQKCYWSRGNGWAFVALARTMEVLPTNDLHYAEYLQTFRDIAGALKSVQRGDGFWNVNLGYTNDFPGPESSGTACFTYGMAWGINHGYLDRATYLPSIINGWNALAIGALHHSTSSDNGFLGYEQPTGSKPADGQPVTYTSVPNFDDFGLGLFLLAGSQVFLLSSSPAIAMDTPLLTNNQVQISFTVVSSLTNATLILQQTDQLKRGWVTNTTATLTTNISGIFYTFTTPRTAPAEFYRIQLGP